MIVTLLEMAVARPTCGGGGGEMDANARSN
jgi:hypothetical protein